MSTGASVRLLLAEHERGALLGVELLLPYAFLVVDCPAVGATSLSSIVFAYALVAPEAHFEVATA